MSKNRSKTVLALLMSLSLLASLFLDSYKKKLKDYPDTERELWAIFSHKPFESMIAIFFLITKFLNKLLEKLFQCIQ